MKLDALQRRLGYQFTDLSLLQQAVTHKSYGKPDNERLEFLGDAVLSYQVAVLLYRHRQDLQEDQMTLVRAHLVRGTTLALKAKGLELGQCLQLGSGELKSGGRERESILADAFEAVVGAIHEDGGLAQCWAFVEQQFLADLKAADPRLLKDAKTVLQEHLQQQGLKLPEYTVVAEQGADHAKRYTVRCDVAELDLHTQAEEKSRRNAEQTAARLLLQQLGILSDE